MLYQYWRWLFYFILLFKIEPLNSLNLWKWKKIIIFNIQLLVILSSVIKIIKYEMKINKNKSKVKKYEMNSFFLYDLKPRVLCVWLWIMQFYRLKDNGSSPKFYNEKFNFSSKFPVIIWKFLILAKKFPITTKCMCRLHFVCIKFPPVLEVKQPQNFFS